MIIITTLLLVRARQFSYTTHAMAELLYRLTGV
jgi:hypothetical protein